MPHDGLEVVGLLLALGADAAEGLLDAVEGVGQAGRHVGRARHAVRGVVVAEPFEKAAHLAAGTLGRTHDARARPQRQRGQ